MKDLIKDKIKRGMVLCNPGGGTSIIIKVTDEYISYRRRGSYIRLYISVIENVCEKFKGQIINSRMLKEYNKKVFSSKDGGHSCNCTFLYMILERIGCTTGKIQGGGRIGNPFYVELK